MWRNRLWKDTSDAVSDLASNQGTRICHRLLKPCTLVLSSAIGAQRGSWGHSDSCLGTINELVIGGQRQGWAGTSRGHLAQLSAQDQSYVRHSWEVVVLFVTAAEARVISRAIHTNAWAIVTVLQMETWIVPGRISASYLSPRKWIIPNHTFTCWALLLLLVCFPFWPNSALVQRFLTSPGPGSQKTRTPCAFKPSASAVPNPRVQSRCAAYTRRVCT